MWPSPFLFRKRIIGMALSSLETLKHFAYLLPLILPAAALAAYAPPEPVTSKDSTIIVTGKKLTKEEARRQASSFVRTATVIPQEDQYARRRDLLCPAVSGIEAKYVVKVVAKITSTAEAVGVKMAKPGCSANLLIHFTNDVSGYIAQMAKVRPDLLRTMRPDERLALKQSVVPMRWLYATEARGTDNMKLSIGGKGASVLVAGAVAAGSPAAIEGVNIQSNRGTLNTNSASLIDTQMIVNLTSTIVIVDAEKSTGFALESVSAYAAMVSLAQIKLSTDYSSYPSILSMFSGAKGADEAPRDLTEWDYAYLRALYKIPGNRTARMQRTKIYGEMVKQLVK
jgi:hypothetical protein